jgi:hypothetical protein
MRKSQSSMCLAALALMLAGCGGNAPTDQAASGGGAPGKAPASGGGLLGSFMAKTTPVEVAAGTELSVALNSALATDVNKSGEEFSATVSEPVVVNSKTVIPRGAKVKGTIVEAVESGRLKGVAVLRLALSALEVDGKSYDIKTANVSRRGDSHTKRNTAMIGGGAGAGAVIGAIAGGGKGAAIGAAVGAGAGTAGAAATGKKDVKIPAETPLKFKLSEPVTVQVKG